MTEHQEATQSKILIVEDEGIIAIDLKSCVEDSGYTVLACVDSAEEALELIEQEPPDLVLMDIVLKGQMNGISAAALIRSRWGIPVIFITAFADPESVGQAKLVSPFGYILKPFQDNEVKALVEITLYTSRVEKERRKGQDLLLQSVKKYRSLAASIDSMYLVDRECSYLFMNEGHRQRFGVSLEEIIGRGYNEFHSKKNSQNFAKKVTEVLKTNKPITQEYRSERDGRVYLRTFTPIINQNPVGEISEVVVVSKDITERKRAEEKLIETLHQLQETKDMLIQSEKEAAIGRLANGVAHEILNPASIISSRLQFLEEELLSEQARENLRVSREQIRRIVKIIQELRQSFAKQPTKLIRGDLRRVIDLGLKMTERWIKKAHIQVEYHPPPEVIPVKMESDKMVKVVTNLFLNACEAMTGNQKKRLIVTIDRPEISLKNFSILLTIADTGQGIPVENLNLIFEPFFTTKDPGKGTGLGLSVSKGIILEHGGTIRAENNDLGGASFIVELPLYHTADAG
ncbi:MAG: ATP-binding protein [Pseudomonadota bacterium]